MKREDGACSVCKNKHQHFHFIFVSTSRIFSNFFSCSLCSERVHWEDQILGMHLWVFSWVRDFKIEWPQYVILCQYVSIKIKQRWKSKYVVSGEILRAAMWTILLFFCYFIEGTQLGLKGFPVVQKQAYVPPYVYYVWLSVCVIRVVAASETTVWLSSWQHLYVAFRRWWLMPFSGTFVADASLYSHYGIQYKNVYIHTNTQGTGTGKR